MAKYVPSKDLEELNPRVGNIIYKLLGYSDPSLVTVIMNCITSGHDKKRMTEKLSTLLDSDRGAKLADRVQDLIIKSSLHKMSQNKRNIENGDLEFKKKLKDEENFVLNAAKPSNPLSANQIKDMMANAQKLIQERKKALNVLQGSNYKEADDKKKKIEQLQAQIQSKINSGVLKTFLPPKSFTSDKPAPLILDSEGRTIDVTGKEVQLTHVVPTLKANIRARKREVFSQQMHDKSSEETTESTFIDPRIPTKSSIRTKRALRFHEPGKFQQLAERMRMKFQLEKLQNEISQIARKTGISSAAKLAQLAPKGEDEVEEIPDMEWWDSVIIKNETYDNIEDENCMHLIKESSITNLVEHPIQMKPPTDPLKPVFMPIFLTRAERKKLRRQNRREAWKEEQEKIRLGLTPPPEPKLRISNLMRVLGTEAVQDPTKMEAHVRAQMAKRQKAHEDANASRKLTDDQKREKNIRKIKEDTTLGVNVSVYRVSDLSSASKKFKVETNAKQLFMTGGVIMFQDCNIIVVEGGPKQQKKFKRLMLNRIKWEEDKIKTKDGEEVPNKCILVWEGMSKQRNFGEVKFKACATEKLAREQLKKHGVEQYWDLAYSKTILDLPDDK
ncbi:hypothetical protein PGB90_000125 [Kerria lacca]